MARAIPILRLDHATGRLPAGTIPRIGAAYWVSGALGLASIAAAAPTLFAPTLLRGLPVMNGSARGTALVVLAAGVPALAISMYAVGRGAYRPLITWLGAAAYLVYNAYMFVLMAPFNSLFLVYLAMFGLGVWSIATLMHGIDIPSLAGRFAASLPARAIGGFLAAVGLLNALAWLVQIVPATVTTKAPPFLDGTGLVTPAGWAQDLAFWIPAIIVSAVWMWRRRPHGLVLGGALLVFGVIESAGIAVDQFMAGAADPASTVASASMAPIFGAVAAVQLIPLYFYFRGWNRA